MVGDGAFRGCSKIEYVCLSSMRMEDVDPTKLGLGGEDCILVCKDGTMCAVDGEWKDTQEEEEDAPVSEDATYATLEDGSQVEFVFSGAIDHFTTSDLKERQPISIQLGGLVTEIGDCAFSGFSNLQRITVPDSIVRIGDYAFKDSGLVEISIPDSVASIGRGAFSGCTKLDSVRLPSGLVEIQEQTFQGCSSLLGPIDIPSSVRRIGDSAFMDCSAESVDPILRIPKQVEEIGAWAFMGVNRLILFQERTKSEISAMSNYPWGVQKIDIIIRPGTAEQLTDKDIPAPHSDETPHQGEGDVDDDVVIGTGTFVKLAPIPLVSSRQKSPLDDLAVATVKVSPSTMRSNGGHPPKDPDGNTTIYFADGTLRTYDWSGEVSMQTMQEAGLCGLKTSPQAVQIGNKVTAIGANAFESWTSLKHVGIPSSVTSIGDNAFIGCVRLKDIALPDSLTWIGENAFMDCRCLHNEIVVPESTTHIGSKAFYGCIGLARDGFIVVGNTLHQYVGNQSNVVVPNGVLAIGEDAFNGCEVKTLTIPKTVQSISKNILNGCPTIKDMFFPDRGRDDISKLENYPWNTS